MDYYSVDWLQWAGNKIGRTLKVDTTTLDAARGKYARACVEIDLQKPLRTSYTFKGRTWGVQYKGLHLLCFFCGRYGHSEVACPIKRSEEASEDRQTS